MPEPCTSAVEAMVAYEVALAVKDERERCATICLSIRNNRLGTTGAHNSYEALTTAAREIREGTP